MHGAWWALLGHLLGQGLALAGNLILTRLLVREVFGLMALVDSAVRWLAMVADVGITASIVQHRGGDDRRFRDTAWTLQILRGALLYGLCLLLTRPVAAYYDKPLLGVLLPVAGLSLLLGGFTSPSLALLVRHLSMRRSVLLQVGLQAATLAVTVVWAWVRRDVWALVAGGLTYHCLQLLLSHVLFPEVRPRLAWHRPSVAALLVFGGWVLVNTPLSFFADQADRFTLGKLFDLSTLGVYAVAVRFGSLPCLVLEKVGGSVAFPAFSRARDAGRPLSAVYDQVRLPVLVAGGTLLAGLCATGPSLVRLLYQDEWHAAGWMLVWVCAAGWFRILSIPGANALFAQGLPRWLVAANLGRLAGFLVCVRLGHDLRGFAGSLAGFAAGEVLGYAIYAAGVRRERLAALGPDLLFTVWVAASAAAGFLLRAALLRQGAAEVVALLAAGSATALFWVGPARRALLLVRPPAGT